MHYHHRMLERELREGLSQFPACLITGARQVGKSTLLQKVLKGSHAYVTLDDPTLCKQAKDDPALFLSTFKAPVIIDEIQYAPELLPYIKMAIDANRQSYGQYILTGSQSFAMMEGVTESLAGRIAIYNLLPFSWEELYEENMPNSLDEEVLRENIFRGFYPEVQVNRNLNPHTWFSSYLKTYIERDLRNIQAISDLGLFQKFLTLLALRAGQILKLSEVAKECGISSPTAKRWLSILESSYMVYLLKPFFRNHGKRLAKSPKIYFYDTGLLCYLLSIDSPARLATILERGHIFENMLVMEKVKHLSFTSKPAQLSYYRTTNQAEVDLIVEKNGILTPYEFKHAMSIKKSMTASLQAFMRDYGAPQGHLVSLYPTHLKYGESIDAIHWSEFIRSER